VGREALVEIDAPADIGAPVVAAERAEDVDVAVRAHSEPLRVALRG